MSLDYYINQKHGQKLIQGILNDMIHATPIVKKKNRINEVAVNCCVTSRCSFCYVYCGQNVKNGQKYKSWIHFEARRLESYSPRKIQYSPVFFFDLRLKCNRRKLSWLWSIEKHLRRVMIYHLLQVATRLSSLFLFVFLYSLFQSPNKR